VRRRAHAALLVAVAVGCAATEQPTIRPHVYEIDRTPGVDIFVEPGRLIVPRPVGDEILARQPGDVLVCARGSGFLRAVVTVEPAASEVVVTTTDARLEDAIAEGHTSTSADFTGASGSLLKGDGKWDAVVPLDGALEVGTTTILDTETVTVRVNRASLRCTPEVELDVGVSNGQLQSFTAIAAGHLAATLDVDVQTHRLTRVRAWHELWRSEPVIFVQMIAELPVVEVLWLRLGVAAEVEADGPLDFGGAGETRGEVRAGAVYDAVTGWEVVGEHALTFVPAGHFYSGDTPFKLSVGLWAQIDFELYDLAGPYILIEPYVAATHVLGTADWQPSIGLRGRWGGMVELFGHEITPYTRELFDLNQPF